jgi:tRNA uridine 5-carboxymethylaminomethyl modification enzyme
MTAAQLLRQPNVRLSHLVSDYSLSLDLTDRTGKLDAASVETTVKYAGYLRQEAARAQRSQKDERRRIPKGFEFSRVPGLSNEVVQRLSQVLPETIGQASRIPGMTPAALAVLGTYVSRWSSNAPELR